ncbi:MAG TPA: hypothetical protein VKY44_03980 [Flavobacterium sp.]|nr:hypothetical protein [Flavobacterium sp.]
MKKTFLLLLSMLFCSLSFGQVETKWETLTLSSKGVTLYYRFVEDDNNYTFEVKTIIFKGMTDLPFTVSEGKKFVFHLEDGNDVFFENNRFSESCLGCGSAGLQGSKAQGAKMYYSMTNEQMKSLLNNSVTSYKFYTDDDSYEIKISKRKMSEFKNHLKDIMGEPD